MPRTHGNEGRGRKRIGREGFMANDDLIVKDTALMNASYNLNLVEQRLILLAISRSRSTGKGITANDYLEIHANDYITAFGADRSSTYKTLKDNCRQLFKREFSFVDGSARVLSRWVSSIRYHDEKATVSLIFTPEIIPYISALEKRFTSYQLNDVSRLTSAYAVRLYELIICWKTIRKTPVFDIESFRSRLGVEDHQYKLMSDFKKRVLDLAIEQINETTNIYVSCEQHKSGRKITGFSFDIVEKNFTPRDPNTVDWVDQEQKVTRKKITKQQAESMAKPGETWAELLARIGKEYHVTGI